LKILVIGGNGFIGSHIIDQLISKGNDVRILDIAFERFRDQLPNVNYFIGGYNDPIILAESLKGIDIVYHLASTTVPETSNMESILDIQGNLTTTVKLLDQMVKSNIKKIVFLSSGGTVYGNVKRTPIKESTPTNPICSYGIVKLAIEKYLYMYHKLYDIIPVIIRPSNPFGPRQGHMDVQGVIHTILTKIVKDEPIEIWGDGSIIRDYIYIKDLADLCELASAYNKFGIFNAGSGIGYTIDEIISLIRITTNKDFDVFNKHHRSFDVKKIILDISSAKKQLNWQPNTNITDGLYAHWEWVKNNNID
jgi:UDP-glucose 4-epimerase